MELGQLHADHIDETGGYGKRFSMVKELMDSGVLTEVPEEFRVKTDTQQQTQSTVPVTDNNFQFYDEFGQKHADHVDESGDYRRAWEAQFGPLNEENGMEEESPANTQWKSFLQQLIAEEKSKLNI